MKKQEFEDKIEQAANRLEDKIERAADNVDKSINRAVKTKVGKVIMTIIHICFILALILSGIILLHFTHTAWAIVCFVAAGIDLIWRILEKFIFED